MTAPAFLLAYSNKKVNAMVKRMQKAPTELTIIPSGNSLVIALDGTNITTVYLPIATVSVANVREHWATRARRAKKQRADAYTLTRILACVPKPTVARPLVIKLTRVSPRMLDSDNSISSLKSVRDGIADRLGIDDRDPRVTWEYGQRKGKPKERAVIVEARR